MHLTIVARGSTEGLPTATNRPCPGKPALGSPADSRRKKAAFSHSTTPSWKGHRQRTGPEISWELSSCLGPEGVPGLRWRDYSQERGGGAGEEERGAGSRQCPAVRPPTVTSVLEATATRISSLLEAASRVGRLPASHARPRPQHSLAENGSAERGRLRRAIGPGAVGLLLPHSGWALVPGDLGKNTVVGLTWTFK